MERYDLSGIWRFCFDPHDEGIEQQWMNKDNQPYLEQKTRILVPGLWNSDAFAPNESLYSGVGWYFKDIKLNYPQTKDYFLHFEGVVKRATIFIDGEQIKTVSGGQIPFSIPITKYNDNQYHFIAIRINSKSFNRDYYSPQIPSVLGGIMYGLKIIGRSRIFLKEKNLELNLHNGQTQVNFAELIFTLQWKNTLSEDFQGNVEVEIAHDFVPVVKEHYKINILKDNTRMQRFIIHVDNDVLNLWTPSEPNVYHLKIILTQGNKVEYEYNDVIGIRDIQIKNNTLFINHEEIVQKAYTVDFSNANFYHLITWNEQLRRLKQIKKEGYNILTSKHGIFPVSFYEIASRIGLLIIPEMPFVKLTSTEKNELLNEYIFRINFRPSLLTYKISPNPDLDQTSQNEILQEIQEIIHNLDPFTPIKQE